MKGYSLQTLCKLILKHPKTLCIIFQVLYQTVLTHCHFRYHTYKQE